MGLWDTLFHTAKGVTEPEQLAEQLIARPWTGTFAAISASSTSKKDFNDAFTGNNTARMYRLERLTIVNNDGTCDISVIVNGDLQREVFIGAGGGSAVLDHPDIYYFVVTNENGSTATTADKISWYGEAFKR